MPEEDNTMKLANVFLEMLEKHLKSTDYNLVINNFILFRNILTQARDDSVLSEEEKKKSSKLEALWDDLNRGCSCTRNKRMQDAIKSTEEFVFSEEGKSSLQKIKSFYKLNSLAVNIPEPVIKCDI